MESNTIYVVDDDDSIRKALKRLLKSAGYHTRTFASAEAFLEFIPDEGGGCLVLDIDLPGITGFELQEKLISRGAAYRIIFMTAFDNKKWQKRAENRGAFGYIKKPFGEKVLLKAIGECRKQMDNHLSHPTV